MPEAAQPLRVGLIGLNRAAWHLIERCTARGPFRILAAHDFAIDRRIAESLSHFGVRAMSTAQELLSTAGVDVIWFTRPESPSSEFVSRAFGSGHDIVVESAATMSLPFWDELAAQAARHDRRLLVHHPRHADSGFRQALAVANDDSLGMLRAAKFTSWSFALPPTGALRNDPMEITAWQQLSHVLDQLVRLQPRPPVHVCAVGPSIVPDSARAMSLQLQIRFDNESQAEIDIRIDSPTPFQCDWLLTGECGGYAGGLRYSLTADGEVFESPVALPDDNEDSLLSLARHLRCDERDCDEARRNRTVVALLDAARRSILARQSVALDR